MNYLGTILFLKQDVSSQFPRNSWILNLVFLCPQTQLHRAYLSPEFIRGLAIVRGTQYESELAESFEVIRLIL